MTRPPLPDPTIYSGRERVVVERCVDELERLRHLEAVLDQLKIWADGVDAWNARAAFHLAAESASAAFYAHAPAGEATAALEARIAGHLADLWITIAGVAFRAFGGSWHVGAIETLNEVHNLRVETIGGEFPGTAAHLPALSGEIVEAAWRSAAAAKSARADHAVQELTRRAAVQGGWGTARRRARDASSRAAFLEARESLHEARRSVGTSRPAKSGSLPKPAAKRTRKVKR